jgi:hypothetical protein
MKTAKMTKRTSNIVVAVAPPLRKTSGETINAAYIKKALAQSLVIFKPKRTGLSF